MQTKAVIPAVPALTFSPATAIVEWIEGAWLRRGDLEEFQSQANPSEVLSIKANSQGLSSIAFGDLPKLKTLEVTNNDLTELQVRNLESLNTLKCSDNRLTSIQGLKRLWQLRLLYCNLNQFKTLVVASNDQLQGLRAYNMPGLCPDIANLKQLRELDLGDNLLATDKVNRILTLLASFGKERGSLYLYGNGVPTTHAAIETLQERGWHLELDGITTE